MGVPSIVFCNALTIWTMFLRPQYSHRAPDSHIETALTPNRGLNTRHSQKKTTYTESALQENPMHYNLTPPGAEPHAPPCRQSALHNVNLLTEGIAIIYYYINFGNSTDELTFVRNHAQSWCERFYETPSFPRDQLTEIRREHPNIFNLRVFCRNRLDYSPNRGGGLYPARAILPHKSAYPVDEFTLYRAANSVATQQDARRQRQPYYVDGYARVRPELEAKWFRDTALHADIPGVIASIARLNLHVVGSSDTKPATFVDEEPAEMGGGSVFGPVKGESNTSGATIVYEMPSGIDTSVSSGSAMVLDYHISDFWRENANPWTAVRNGDLAAVGARFVDEARRNWSYEPLQFDGLNILDDMEADSEGGTVDAGWDETQTDTQTEDGNDVDLEKGKGKEKAEDERPTGFMGWCRWILCGRKTAADGA